MEIVQIAPMSLIIVLSILVALLILCRMAVAMRWLTVSGSIAAFFTALILLWGGWHLFLLPLVLLLGGSLLSRLNRDGQEKEGRNAIQVLANGGIGLLCLLGDYTGTGDFYAAYIVSFSISICDTFSSEIGKYFNGRTVDIISFKPVVKGLSGGISIQGTLGGLAGAAICSVIAFSWLGLSASMSLIVLVLAMAGMFLDSFLGSLLRAKYIAASGKIEEHPSITNQLYKGFDWCTNDTVNLLSNIVITSLYIIVYFHVV